MKNAVILTPSFCTNLSRSYIVFATIRQDQLLNRDFGCDVSLLKNPIKTSSDHFFCSTFVAQPNVAKCYVPVKFRYSIFKRYDRTSAIFFASWQLALE